MGKIFNMFTTDLYLGCVAGIIIILSLMSLYFNRGRLVHFFVSQVVHIEPYDETKKLIRFKGEDSDSDYTPEKIIKKKSRSTDLATLKAFETASGVFHKKF